MTKPPKSDTWPILLVLLLYGVFATAYALVTPYRSPGYLATTRQVVPDYGAPDERAHANYVARLLGGEGLGVLRPDDPQGAEHYQFHQPPLYYVLAAGWCRLVGADPQDAETGRRLRFLNVSIGVATALGIYFAAIWGLGNVGIARCAMAVGALMPMHLALCAAVSNDPLLIALSSWTIATCAYGLRFGWSAKRAVLLGVVVGLALLTKTSALALVPAAFVALLWGQRRSESLSRRTRMVLIAAGTAAVLVVPWWARNLAVYGDPLAMNAFRASFTGTAQAEDFILAFGAYDYWTRWVGWWTLRSFFGAFGYMDIFLPSPLYVVLTVLSGLCGVVGAWSWWKDRAAPMRGFTLVATIFFIVVIAQFIYFNTVYFQGQGRYLYPAVAPIACALATGVWIAMRKAGWCWLLPTIGLVALNLYCLRVAADGFAMRAVSP
jgi:4-amino-4-deoxy-L-arabinose transferase-like glycosyltransferase